MKTSEILTQAAGFVAQGHCKDILEDPEGRVCALGALNKAVTGDAWGYANGADYRAREAMGQVILEQYADRRYVVAVVGMPLSYYPLRDVLVPFNNASTTTGAEVVAVMEKAAANLQEVGQ